MTFLWKSATEAVPRLSAVLQDPGLSGGRGRVGLGAELAALADRVSSVSVRPLLAEQPRPGVASREGSAPAGLDGASGRSPVLFGGGRNDDVVILVLLLDGLPVEVAVASEAVDVALDGVVERLEHIHGVGRDPPPGGQLPGKGGWRRQSGGLHGDDRGPASWNLGVLEVAAKSWSGGGCRCHLARAVDGGPDKEVVGGAEGEVTRELRSDSQRRLAQQRQSHRTTTNGCTEEHKETKMERLWPKKSASKRDGQSGFESATDRGLVEVGDETVVDDFKTFGEFQSAIFLELQGDGSRDAKLGKRSVV